MRVLIVENEIYLAQSIAAKLADFGYDCEIAHSYKEALDSKNFDVILLSTGIIGQDFYPVIKKHSNSIIILLISYISNDTVSNPIKSGASDYIQKPFMMEELIRKIKFFEIHKRYEILTNTYENIIDSFYEFNHYKQIDIKKLKLPLIIQAKDQRQIDSFVYHYCKELNITYKYIKFSGDEVKISNLNPKILLYLTNFEDLTDQVKNQILQGINKRLIIASTKELELAQFDCIKLENDQQELQTRILAIDEYIKHIIIKYQNTLTDIEISKQLGISRKSLWEKRKKYDIKKKK